MADSFATVGDLRARGVEVGADSASVARAEAALADASALLRSEIGWQVYPPAAVSLVQHGWCGSVSLPGSPVSDVSVQIAGSSVPAEAWWLDGSTLHLRVHGSDVAVTYSVGYEQAPDELVAWTCVIAADGLSRDPADAGARPAYESLADWRVGYSARQQAGEAPVPDRVMARLRATYGNQTAYVT